jgi:hypothetical protein
MIRMGVGMGRPIRQALWSKGVPARAKRSRQALSRGIQRQKMPSTGSQIEIQGRRTLMECHCVETARLGHGLRGTGWRSSLPFIESEPPAGNDGCQNTCEAGPPSRAATVASQLSPAPPVFNSFDGLDAISPRVGPR